MIEQKLNAFQRHVLIGTAIRMRGGEATPRQIGETTGFDLTRINADLCDMEREKTVVRVDHLGENQTPAAKSSRFTWRLKETAA